MFSRVSRSRAALSLGAASAAVAAAIVALWPDDEPELTPAPALAVAPPPPLITTPPAPPPTADLSGVKLQGVLGDMAGRGSAIFELNGTQRLIGVGRELLPGATLQSVTPDRVTIALGGQSVELTLDKEGATTAAAPSPDTATAGSLVDYRLGLKPAEAKGGAKGYRLAPGASLPLLAKAGLQPGDLILAINGTPTDREERILELPAEIAAASALDIDFERGGRRQKATVPTGR